MQYTHTYITYMHALYKLSICTYYMEALRAVQRMLRISLAISMYVNVCLHPALDISACLHGWAPVSG